MYGRYLHRYVFGCLLTGLLFVFASTLALAKDSHFQIEEASIDDLQRAIQAGEVTCQGIVRAYIDRAKAYNGICTKLVTNDGSSIADTLGTVRGGAPLKFPTDTVAIKDVLPDFDQYKGLPIEYGRMEPTSSDLSVKQQYGMVVGVADAKQVNALSTLNIRGERSNSCSKVCDASPLSGALPQQCPASCESLRQQPDALERAAALDKQY